MSYEVREFTKDKPCSKLDFWNCFRSDMEVPVFYHVPVIVAQSIIGKRSIKYWMDKGWMGLKVEVGDESYYLTEKGKEHLKSAIVTYLNNPVHRGLRSKVKSLPRELAEKLK